MRQLTKQLSKYELTIKHQNYDDNNQIIGSAFNSY